MVDVVAGGVDGTGRVFKTGVGPKSRYQYRQGFIPNFGLF
jgi:hypothetical protein